MRTAIRKHFKDFLAVIGLVLVAGAVSVYILGKQRMRFPIVQDKPFVLKAEFQTAQAVIAGQGQTVRVSGVRIGDIGAVELKDGRAIVRMDIDSEYKELVRTNATALLRPKTGLKDMFIQLEPGTKDAPVAEENWTIPVQATTPDVNPDEILSTLDADTRDYLRLLISDAGRGLKGRGGDLRDLFRRFEPTHRDLAAVNGAIATRRTNLRRLISSLNELNGELARRDDDLAELVDSSAGVLRAFASEEQSISAAVGELPSTLRQTTASLGQVQRFAEVLGPTTDKLRPAARALDPANKAIEPFAEEVAPLLASDIRPFVRE
ncbi:MAG: MlaD family protein, partial [Solirubrobacteraceae bacterium]